MDDLILALAAPGRRSHDKPIAEDIDREIDMETAASQNASNDAPEDRIAGFINGILDAYGRAVSDSNASGEDADS